MPDGVGIRNYLYSDVFKSTGKELVLLHNLSPETIADLRKEISFSAEFFLPDYNESLKEKFLRELICLKRLRYNTDITSNPTILTYWNTRHKTLSKKIFYKIVEIAALASNDYASILKLEKLYQKEIRKNIFYRNAMEILRQIDPEVIFCTHQRGLKAAPIFAAANEMGITSATAIYSWDNLPKARMALRGNKYFVWSDYMKQEMQMFYPEIPLQDMVVSGTPQFEFYRNDSNVIPRTNFFQRYNLDESKKIICFSGDDELTSPDDPKYLEDVAVALTQSGLAQHYQILFRRSPADFSGRYNEIIERHTTIIREAPPLWHFRNDAAWATIYPSTDDVRLLVSTAYYCDVVINLGSTMAFDFHMFGKPCIFINYDQDKKQEPDWSVETIYRFQHFRSMPAENCVVWLNGQSEITAKIEQASQLRSEANMQQWFKKIIGNLNASAEIPKALKL